MSRAGFRPASRSVASRLASAAATTVFAAILAAGWLSTVATAAQQQPTPDMSPLSPGVVQRSDPPELVAVMKGLMCRCGCNLTVYACQGSMTCDVSWNMRLDAKRLLGQGMSVQQALDSFAAQHGEEVLAAPTKTGFNLTAWVLPFAALAVGLAVVGFALRTWRPQQETVTDADVGADPRWVAAVEDELERED